MGDMLDLLPANLVEIAISRKAEVGMPSSYPALPMSSLSLRKTIFFPLDFCYTIDILPLLLLSTILSTYIRYNNISLLLELYQKACKNECD
jgi:hypothetical protein